MTFLSFCKVSSAVLFFCVFLSITTQAQKASDIVQKYRDALKKSADKNALQTVTADAEITIMDVKLASTMKFKAPNCMRVEMNIMGKTFIQLSNDSLDWEFNPMTNSHRVIVKDKKEKSRLDRVPYLDYRLADYKGHNLDIEYKGKEKLDSLEVFRIELHEKDSDRKITFFLNTRTYLVYKVEDLAGKATFLDYKEFDGFTLPQHTIEENRGQTIAVRYLAVKFNPHVNDEEFIVPASAKKAVHESDIKARKDYSRADSLYKVAKFKDAEAEYTAAIGKHGNTRDAVNGRGLTRIALGDFYGAVADFTSLINVYPDYAVAYNNRGLAKYNLNDDAGSKQDLDKAVALDPKLTPAYKNRGMLYLKIRSYEEAVKDFQQALQLKPDDYDAFFKYGLAVASQKRFEEAKRLYDKAYDGGYRSAEFFNFRGVTLYQLAQFDSARIDFAEAVRLEGGNLQYIENLGRAFMKLGNYNEADEQFQSYLSKKTDNSEIYNLMGLCHYYDENYKVAIKEFGRAIELQKSVPDYYGNRAMAKEHVDDYVGALNDYSEYIRISPSDPAVFFKRGMVKIKTSKKLEGCMDLGTAKEMGYEAASAAIISHCN
jgi:tetratricopeptide (TPR) repeat protein